MRVDRHREEIAIAESLTDLGGTRGERFRRCGVAAEAEHRRLQHRHESELDAVRQIRGVPLGPGEPSGAGGLLAAEQVFDAQARGHPARTPVVAVVDVARVRPLSRRDRLVLVGRPPRRVGERLPLARGEVGGFEPFEDRVGLGPRSPLDGVPRLLEIVDPLGHVASSVQRPRPG